MTDTISEIKPRMKNPAVLIPGAGQAVQALAESTKKGGVPEATLELVHLRASQINGCSFCVDYGWRNAKKTDAAEEKLFAVAAWRDAPYFTDAERAALALAEAVTRLSDRPDPVPDELWNEVTRQPAARGAHPAPGHSHDPPRQPPSTGRTQRSRRRILECHRLGARPATAGLSAGHRMGSVTWPDPAGCAGRPAPEGVTKEPAGSETCPYHRVQAARQASAGGRSPSRRRRAATVRPVRMPPPPQ